MDTKPNKNWDGNGKNVKIKALTEDFTEQWVTLQWLDPSFVV